MTVPVEQNQSQDKQQDKELNFRALEAKALQAQRRAEEAERRASDAERLAQELANRNVKYEDEDEDDEPYVDRRKLNKKLAKFGEETKQQTQNEIQRAVAHALEAERQKNWLKQNPDFYDVLQHADKFAKMDEELAETILSMPEGFDRQKLVYKNIKALGLHKPPEEKKSAIQERIDANKRSPSYQPSGVGSAPYGVYTTGGKDYSEGEMKNAYHDVMKRLQKTIRL